MSRFRRPGHLRFAILSGLLAAWLRLGWPGFAAAGDEPAPDLPKPAAPAPDTLDRIVDLPGITVTAARRATRERETPRQVTLVTSRDVSERLVTSMPDALGEAPEILVQKTNLGGGSPIVRGLTGHRVLLMMDGIRLNNCSYRLGPNQYANTIDPELIGRLEVVAGPGSALQGSDALGGVINVRSPNPEPAMPRLVWRAEFDPRNDSQTHGVRLGRAGPRGGFLLTGGWRDFGDLYAGGGRRQRPTGYSDWSASGKVVMQSRGEDRLTAAWQSTRQSDVPRTDRVVAGQDSLNLYDPQDRDLGYVRYEWRLPGPGVEALQATLSWNRQKEGRRTISRSNLNRLREELDEVKTVGAMLEGRQALDGATLLQWGGEFYRDEVDSRATDTNRQSGAITGRPGRYPADAHQESGGLFLRAQRPVGPDWLLAGAARASWIDLSGTPQGPFGHVDISNRDLTGSLELRRAVGVDDYLYMAAGRAFRAPSMEDALTTGLSAKGWDVPNPGLGPESLVSVEVGTKLTGGVSGASMPGWTLDLNGYLSRIDDLVERVPATWLGSDSLEGEPVFHFANAGRGRIVGASANGAVSFGGAREWSARGGVSWTLGDNLETDTPLSRIPPLRGLAALRRRVGDGRVEAVVQWARRQDRLSPDDRRDSRIPEGGTKGYAVVSLRGECAVRGGVVVRAMLENIGDVDYRLHGSGVDGAGRRVVVGVEWRWGGGGQD